MKKREISANLRGALWILASCAAATVVGLGIRGLTGQIHSMQITFARCLLGLLLLLPFMIRGGRRRLATPRLPLHLLRALLGVVAINFGFYSLTVLPLTTASVLFFTAPLFVTVLAALVLREVVGWRRWSATAVGFAGTLIVLQPASGGFEPDMLFAIGSSILFAASLIISKVLARTESATTMLFYFGVVASIASLPPALVAWTWPSSWEFALLALVAAFATLRSYFDIRGYAVGAASFVAPFQYFRLPLIGIAAWVAFGEVPKSGAMIGAAVIVASTLYISERELRLKRAARPAGVQRSQPP